MLGSLSSPLNAREFMPSPLIDHWTLECQARGLQGKVKCVAVSHKRWEFTRNLPVKKKPSSMSSVAGTQCVDRWWQALDRFIPSQLHKKLGKGKGLNENLFSYVFAFVWRDQLPRDVDMRAALGALCS